MENALTAAAKASELHHKSYHKLQLLHVIDTATLITVLDSLFLFTGHYTSTEIARNFYVVLVQVQLISGTVTSSLFSDCTCLPS